MSSPLSLLSIQGPSGLPFDSGHIGKVRSRPKPSRRARSSLPCLPCDFSAPSKAERGLLLTVPLRVPSFKAKDGLGARQASTVALPSCAPLTDTPLPAPGGPHTHHTADGVETLCQPRVFLITPSRPL